MKIEFSMGNLERPVDPIDVTFSVLHLLEDLMIGDSISNTVISDAGKAGT